MTVERTPIQPEDTETIISVLTETRALVDNPDTWTKGTGARNADGMPTPARGTDAVCFCLVGAVNRVAYLRGLSDEMHVLVALDLAAERTVDLPTPSKMPDILRPAAYVNDYLGREAAVALIDNALEKLNARPAE